MISSEDEQELFDDVKSIRAYSLRGMSYECKRVGELRDIFTKIFAITQHWVPNGREE